MSNYTIVRLGAENIALLYTLYERVYQKKCADHYFHLKYNTTYTGSLYIGYFALENNQPIAYYGVVPTNVSLKNSIVLAAQSCDTMTHPEHRKKGLFTELAGRTFELAKKEGVHFVFGFPNQNSYPGFIERLAFTHSETLNRYTMVFSDSLLKKLFRKYNSVLARKERVLLKNTLLEQEHDGIIYDKDYFNYKRYNKNFTLIFKTGPVWLNQSGDLWMGATSVLETKEIMEQLLYVHRITKAASVTFMISPGTIQDALFSEILKPAEGFPAIIKNLSGIYSLDKLKFQFADIDIF
jgi:hypothetical protein